MFRLTCWCFSFRHFFVATPLTLPDGIGPARIRRVLIDGAIRRDDLSTATRTHPASGSPLFNVDAQEILLSHKISLNY